MPRINSITIFPLVAIICCALAGSAGAATGTAPAVTGGDPPAIGTQVSATPSDPLDSAAWETCADGTPDGNVLAMGTADTTTTYTLLLSDAGIDPCAVELDPLGDVEGYSDPIGLVEGLPAGAGPTLSSNSQPVTAGQALSQVETLVVSAGDWGAAQSIDDVWEDCDASGEICAPVATAPSYALSRSDVGSTIEVFETATAANGASSSAITPLTGDVSATPPILDTTNPPTVSGTPQVGDTLTASPGAWSNEPTSYAYQWVSCSSGVCTPIQGATSPTYVPVAAELGDELEVDVAGVIDPGEPYGSAGTAYPSYPTNAVFGISSSSSSGSSSSGTSSSTSGPSSSGSSSSGSTVAPVVAVTNSQTPNVLGRLTAMMQWTFRYAPSYTQVVAFGVNNPAVASTITTRCSGKSCPFKIHRLRVRELKRCRSNTTGTCRAPHSVNLEREFRTHKLGVGTHVTVTITRSRDVGKYYRFIVRRRRAPAVKISCLAPGSSTPGKDCAAR
jgi:hypothetical protein